MRVVSKIISERSLICFMEDLRRLLVYFKEQIPEYVDFINIESFYFYMRLAYPGKFREMEALMDIVEPFIPLIISPRNLEEVLWAYEQGNSCELTRLEEIFLSRSKFIFMNSVMAAQNTDWDNIVAICKKIRAIKLNDLNFV